jgi:hypothetical protein
VSFGISTIPCGGLEHCSIGIENQNIEPPSGLSFIPIFPFIKEARFLQKLVEKLWLQLKKVAQT